MINKIVIAVLLTVAKKNVEYTNEHVQGVILMHVALVYLKSINLIIFLFFFNFNLFFNILNCKNLQIRK